MIRNGEKYKYIADYKGSVVKVIKMSDGSIAQEISYDVWGNVLSDSNPGFQPFYYVGGLYDVDTKLVKFGVRSYDPEVGRWLQKEPLGFKGALNFYSYCGGEPVNWVDLDGLKMGDVFRYQGKENQKAAAIRAMVDALSQIICSSIQGGVEHSFLVEKIPGQEAVIAYHHKVGTPTHTPVARRSDTTLYVVHTHVSSEQCIKDDGTLGSVSDYFSGYKDSQGKMQGDKGLASSRWSVIAATLNGDIFELHAPRIKGQTVYWDGLLRDHQGTPITINISKCTCPPPYQSNPPKRCSELQ